jgi:C1A family cysteine protease
MTQRNAFLALFLTIFIISLGLFQGKALWRVLNPELPTSYNLEALDLAPDLRAQAWGTCWIFAGYSSMESNLKKTGQWEKHESGPVDLAEYHLDKYSGFTRKGDQSHLQEGWYSGQGEDYPGTNTDDLTSGLIVHLGGDYKAIAAFMGNTQGAVQERLTPQIPRGGDHKLFGDQFDEGILKEADYTYFVPRHIEWLSLFGTEDEKRDRVKRAIMEYGAVASAQVMEDRPLGLANNGKEIHATLKPIEPDVKLNHAITLIGWDDELRFKGHQGAWIAQDSDHENDKGEMLGRFYVLYDDAYAAKDEQMGAVIFRDVKKTDHDRIYSHALHGAQYVTSPKDNVEKLAVKFRSQEEEKLEEVSFYTTQPNQSYTLTVVESLDESKILTRFQGRFSMPGLHFLDVDQEIYLKKGEAFYLILEFEKGGHAYDASFEMDVALHSGKLPTWGDPVDVNSKAQKDEGHYFYEGHWRDFSDFISKYNKQKDHPHAKHNATASPAIHAYTSIKTGPLD